MVPIHPGRILRRELRARNLSANALSRALRVPSGRIVDILNGKRSISAETALRLGRYFGNDPQLWINLQAQYDALEPHVRSMFLAALATTTTTQNFSGLASR